MTLELEPIDVFDGLFEAYDASGNSLELKVGRPNGQLSDMVRPSEETIIVRDTDINEKGKLGVYIKDFAVKNNLRLDESSIESMVKSLGEV